MSELFSYKFRLYIAGDSPNSTQATMNFKAFCQEHLPDRHEIELVDVLREPRQALNDGVLLTPTLVKLSPEPVRKIIGTLKETAILLQTLGLKGD